jgi:Zn-dependent protease with chaperone function
MSQTVAAPAGPIGVPLATGRIQVERWPTERPLLLVSILVSLLVWVVAIVTLVGMLYAAMLGLFFFVVHLGFIAHIRGSGVRLGPDQFPELYGRVASLSMRMGLEKVPDTYLMQAGGSLNAFATRFLGSNIVVLFSDLLEACGENEAARDMIIAHELGHVRAGHLRWHWFLLPSKLVPFLGSALSRAREYTCDRYGLAGAGDRDGALLGLTILAAGGAHGPRVNRQALVRQRSDIDTGWMTIGEWFASHPPLVKRILELDPSLRGRQDDSRAGTVRALAIVGMVVLPFIVAGWVGISRLPAWFEEISRQAAEAGALTAPTSDRTLAETRANFDAVASFLAAEQAAGRPLPENIGELYDRWEAAYPGAALPIDPFDGDVLGYSREDGSYTLWSSGPDGEPGTPDDIVFTP